MHRLESAQFGNDPGTLVQPIENRRAQLATLVWCRQDHALRCRQKMLGMRYSAFVILAGYFARRVMPKPAHLDAPGVREICSVSECMSPGADDWIAAWRHNGLGWFNRVADALSVVPEGQRHEFRVFAYRVHPEVFRDGRRRGLSVPADVRPEPLPPGFRTIGFDSAGKSSAEGLSLECSPLSCNGLAAELPVNEHCLFPSLAAAIAGAERFGTEQPEPGDYYVVEVLEDGPSIDPSRSTNAERAST